jgi:hypothetical protein
MHARTARHAAGLAGLALALAACGGDKGDAAATDSAAAASSPDSAGLQTTPPQPNGPMNMVDSAARAPLVADSPPGRKRP